MKFGICGYGNLGKAVEKIIIERGEDELVGIFSRRGDVISASGVQVYPLKRAREFEGKIDVMIMCGGSQEDLIWQTPEMLEHFDVIDTFDTHAKIPEHKKNLENVAKKTGHRAIYSCGWDPGLFSIMRVLSVGIFSRMPQTFWGRGVSQGHSEALRNIVGVQDAIQFTVPNEKLLKEIESNPAAPVEDREKHIRECYICLTGERSFEEIKNQILNTENYFKGQEVIVHEVSREEIAGLKQKLFHKGVVIGGDGEAKIKLEAEMQSNPLFTAQIILAFAPALQKLESGAYSVLDVPIGDIGREENELFL